MDLKEWLDTLGREALAKLAEDMPSGTHGKTKPMMIEWIVEDPWAHAHALETRRINEELEASLDARADEVGFVNRRGDAL